MLDSGRAIDDRLGASMRREFTRSAPVPAEDSTYNRDRALVDQLRGPAVSGAQFRTTFGAFPIEPFSEQPVSLISQSRGAVPPKR